MEGVEPTYNHSKREIRLGRDVTHDFGTVSEAGRGMTPGRVPPDGQREQGFSGHREGVSRQPTKPRAAGGPDRRDGNAQGPYREGFATGVKRHRLFVTSRAEGVVGVGDSLPGALVSEGGRCAGSPACSCRSVGC